MNICIYHRVDPDGWCSAAIVHKALGGNVYHIGVNHSDSYNFWDKLSPNTDVYIVDFSFNEETMKRIINLSKSVTWIDHHKTAIDALEGKFDLEGIRRNGTAACVLTWEHFFPNKEMPLAVKLIGDYDIWNHEDCRIKPFNSYMYSLDYEERMPYSLIWNSLLSEQNKIEEYIIKGKDYLRIRENENKAIAISSAFPLKWEGINFLVANVSGNSSILDSIFNPFIHDAVLLFVMNKEMKWKVSMFTSKEIDLSAIAVKYGGGGHAKACGFICDKIPFF